MITVSAGGSLTGVNVMSGDGTRAEGWKVAASSQVKKQVSIPVCATGNIRHPQYVDKIIKDEKCDMVGMGRGIFAEREWVKKCAEGREDELRYCISCMNCWNYGFIPGQSGCSVNPYAGREEARKELKKDGNGRVVAVVGAGPAGCEAALTLAERGFKPVSVSYTHLDVYKRQMPRSTMAWTCSPGSRMSMRIRRQESES